MDAEKRVSRVVIVVLALCGIAGAAMAIRQIAGEVRRVSEVSQIPSMFAVPEFTLTRQTGDPFSSEDLKGFVWIADFVFTRCAGPCPKMTLAMADLQKSLQNQPQIRLVSFTVDPEHDTPAVLTRYASDFGANPQWWHFLTGDRNTIYDLCIKGFKLAVDTGEEYEHRILHSTKFVLVDSSGVIRGYYEGLEVAEAAKLVHDAKLLAQQIGRP